MEYKKPLSTIEQIEYLSKNKRIIFEETIKSRDLLLRYNYINVVSPFKHIFARNNSNDPYKSDRDENHKHIYDRDVRFEEYLEKLSEERRKYSEMYDGLHKFESAYRSIVSNFFLSRFQIDNSEKATRHFEIIKKRFENVEFQSKFGEERAMAKRLNIIDSINGIIYRVNGNADRKIEKTNIYLVFERLSLKELNAVFFGLPYKWQEEIVEKLSSWKLDFGAKNLYDFKRKAFNLVSIRNSIMHFNSLTILLKYSDYKKGILRERNSRENYIRLMNGLTYISQNVKL